MKTLQAPGRPARLTWLAGLAALAVGLAVYFYFTGEAATMPLRTVPHLQPVALVLDSVAAGPVRLPVQASGFITTLTHDVAGPFTQPLAAALLLGLLAVMLAGWVAVASTLTRGPFVVGMVPVIFFLLSLNTEALGLFGSSERYFLYLLLGLIGGAGYVLHAFAEAMRLPMRAAIMGLIVAGLSAVLLTQSQLPPAETVLQLAAYATPGGAVLVALVVLWVGIENVRALLWFNTQAEQPGGRFGLLPFLAASLLYVGTLLLYVWNNGQLELGGGLHLDPLGLLLPAVAAGWLGLRLRAPSYGTWVPFATGAAQVYPLAVLGAAGALGYALATANTPLLVAARSFTGAALALLGGAFLLYVLMNFGPLIKQRLQVYRVVFEPRRLPMYPVYILAIGGLVFMQSRQGFPLPDQVLAGQFNLLGDLARQQSEADPDDLALAGLAERYYAESGDVRSRFNLHAELGRAALYRFRLQRQNEINALRRALLRGPSEKVSVRLASRYNEPDDLFEGLDVLRKGLRGQPRSAPLAGDLAQLFTRTALTDSVAFYLDKAEQLAPGSYPSRTNQLGFLLSENLLAEARKKAGGPAPKPTETALLSNLALLALRSKSSNGVALPAPGRGPLMLDAADFALLYHGVLLALSRHPEQLTPALFKRIGQLASHPANADYYEQLQFLQALGHHARGEELLARQLLLPLATGTSATAAYYQQLLGLWQLQQGQYATAADQLAFAAAHGANTAAEMRVYALALTGQPDSVRAATARLLTSADTAQQRLGQRAQRLLAAASGSVLATTKARIGSAWLVAAQAAAAARGDVKMATAGYQRIVREAPFNEAAVLAAAGFFRQQRQSPAAYEALRAGLSENPQSLPLLRAYVLAAADAGLSEYAAEALGRLRQRLPAAAYATLAAEYAAHQAARRAAAASFAGEVGSSSQ